MIRGAIPHYNACAIVLFRLLAILTIRNISYLLLTPLAGVIMIKISTPLPQNATRIFKHAALRTDVISILLVDDHALVREGLRQLFTLQEDIQVVGEAEDGDEALRRIRHLHPDVVLMDIHMPDVDGIAVTQQITHDMPDVAVIMLTMYRDQHHMVQAMKSGARGYLLKNSPIGEVAQAIRIVHAGGTLVEPEMTGAIVSELRRLSERPAKKGQRVLDLLTEKELEIVRYVAAGMSNKEIADKLAYSEKTVKNYLSVIFQKLNIRDRTQAAILALRQGILLDEQEFPHPNNGGLK